MEPANEPEPERTEADCATGDGEPSDTSDEEHNSIASTSDPIVCEEKESLKIQKCSDTDFSDKLAKDHFDTCDADGLDESIESTLPTPNVENCEPETFDSETSDSLPASTAGTRFNVRGCRCSRRSSPEALESDTAQHSNESAVDNSETPKLSLSALDLAESERWSVVDRQGTVVEEDDGLPLTTTAIEAKMEQLLTWMLAPAIHGIPKLGVLGAVDRASELLKLTPGRTVEDAVHEVVAGSERSVSLIVMNFCIERIPVLGCPTVLLRTMWGNLRSILIIAALYGHDLETPRVQHEALLCLVPPGEDENDLRSKPQWSRANSEASPIVDETAERVAKMLIKGALRRATGLQAAADCFELASILYRTCSHESVDEDGYVCILSTPASAARDFFRQKSLASHAIFWGSLPLLLMGVVAPALLAFARLAPIVGQLFSSFAQVPSKLPSCVPALVMALPGLLLAIHALRGGMHSGRQRWSARRLWYRIAHGQKAQWLRNVWPKVVTMSVFTLHAMLPAISAFSSVSMVLDSAQLAWDSWSQGWDLLHACACLVLGIYSGCQCMNTQLKNEFAHITSDSDSRFVRGCLRVLNISWAVARACCVLAAWIYALLAIDLATTRLGDVLGLAGSYVGMHKPSAFGFMSQMAWLLGALPDTSPLWSQKAISFCISLISVACQQQLLEVLSRREVLLRLIGAEKVTASSICLLLKGVAVACSHSKSSNPIAEFFQTVAPSQSFCIFVVALRRQAVAVGTAISLVPRLIRSGALGNTVSFLFGVVGGAYAARSVLEVWYTNHEDLDSPALRIALLVPGSVSGKAKILLGGALHGARKRAVKLMAVGIIQRFVRWCFPPNPALTM